MCSKIVSSSIFFVLFLLVVNQRRRYSEVFKILILMDAKDIED